MTDTRPSDSTGRSTPSTPATSAPGTAARLVGGAKLAARIGASLAGRIALITIPGTLLSWLLLLVLYHPILRLARVSPGEGAGGAHSGAIAALWLVWWARWSILAGALFLLGFPFAYFLAGKAWAMAFARNRLAEAWGEPLCEWLAERIEARLQARNLLQGAKGPERWERLRVELDTWTRRMDGVPWPIGALVRAVLPGQELVEALLQTAREHDTLDRHVIALALVSLMNTRVKEKQAPALWPAAVITALVIAAAIGIGYYA